MSCKKLIVAWFILAMVFPQGIQIVRGRQLNSLGRTNDFQKFHNHQETKEPTKNQMTGIHEDIPEEANANKPQYPASIHVTSDTQSPPSLPPSAGRLNDFRPTSPGRSPGAGHSLNSGPKIPRATASHPYKVSCEYPSPSGQ